MVIQIQLRRGTAAVWSTSNPVLAEGEMALETDTSHFKIGDGVQHWNTLPYGALGAGMPVGGTKGQFLIKNSTADYDIQWGELSTQASINFGATEVENVTSVIASTWVQATTLLKTSMALVDTTDHLAEEMLVEGVTVYPTTNIIPGVSFEIECFAPGGTWGQYKVNITGA